MKKYSYSLSHLLTLTDSKIHSGPSLQLLHLSQLWATRFFLTDQPLICLSLFLSLSLSLSPCILWVCFSLLSRSEREGKKTDKSSREKHQKDTSEILCSCSSWFLKLNQKRQTSRATKIYSLKATLYPLLNVLVTFHSEWIRQISRTIWKYIYI